MRLRRSRRPAGRAALAAVAVAALALAGCATDQDEPATSTGLTGASTTTTPATAAPPTSADPTDPTDPTGSAPPAAQGPPALEVTVVADDLALPWDVQLMPDGTALVTERGGRLLAVPDALGADGPRTPEPIDLPIDDLFVSGEAGLMGLALSPDVATDRTVYLCHAATPADGPPDVRVTRWRLADDLDSATPDGVLVAGIPLSSGRHSGCRLLVDDGVLLIGTGDAAESTHPQDLTSLGGKVLAVTLDEGEATQPDGHVVGADPRILTYGHRNVQGLAQQPGTGTIWEVEHGPDADDEVNVLVPGTNYGWSPGPPYDESVSMTDLDRFPDAREAAWSSGDPTHATSGATFLAGAAWGAWDGALAVAELRGSGVSVLTVEGEGVTDVARPAELDGTFGRLRSLTLDADGALWVTSSNGENDVLLRVVPVAGGR